MMRKCEKDGDDITLKKDAMVEAKCGGWTRYFKGQITEVNNDGTYNILFEDGERKERVKSEQIKGNKSNVKIYDALDVACANGHGEIVKLLVAVDGIDLH